MSKCGKDLGIDLSAKDHLGEVQRVVVRNSPTLDHRLNDPKLLGEFRQLFTAAMNHANANTNLVQKRELLCERNEDRFVFCNLSRKLNDECLSPVSYTHLTLPTSDL